MHAPTAAAPATQPASRLALTADEIDAWDRDGFHIHPEPLFTARELAALRGACDAVAHRRYASGRPPGWRNWEPDASPTAVCKIDNAWYSDAIIEAAVTSPRIGRIAAQLVGAHGIRLWHDQYLRKPADGGGIVAWHQDWMFWQDIDRPRTVTCWIALADVAADQGPMLFLPGSHHAGLRQHLMPSNWTGAELPPAPVEGEPVPVVVRAGQVSFHHANLVHASAPNRSATDRLSLVTHTMADDCRWRPGQGHLAITDMLRQGERTAPGQRFRGPQFPWLWHA